MRNFKEVFPTLRLDARIESLASLCEIEKITTTSERDCLYIHLRSSNLFARKDICSLERSISEQICSRAGLSVHIIEHYHLSGQYTPENLWKVYGDSIRFELSQKSPVSGRILSSADVWFTDGDKIHIELEDTIAARGRSEEIVSFIRTVYDKRCQIPVTVELTFRNADISRTEQIRERKLAGEVERVLNQALEHTGAAEQQKKGGRRHSGKKKDEAVPDDPDLLFGRDFSGEFLPLCQIEAGMGVIVCRGQILNIKTITLHEADTLFIFGITDFTDSITVKLYLHEKDPEGLSHALVPGAFISLTGTVAVDQRDGELVINTVKGIRRIDDFSVRRHDHAVNKRVELHCHTKMSDMDGISSADDIVRGAMAFGHKAVAITDHGVVHAFPEAYHTLCEMRSKHPDKVPEGFKILYGMEGYIVDDLIDIVVNDKGQSLSGSFVVFDLETTGFNSIHDKIIEIGAVKICGGRQTDTFSAFVNPKVPIPFRITQLTKITDEMVMDAETIDEILPRFLEFIGDSVLVAHNAGFDVGFLSQSCRNQDIVPDFTYLDTVALARILLPTLSKYKLDAVAKQLGISLENHHRAVDDAGCTAEIFLKFVSMLSDQNIKTLGDINRIGTMTPEMIRKLPSYHIILLAQNEEGRKNLYRLVSMSHLKYFSKRPRLPKSEIIRHREGLILGSACVAGELFDAMLSQRAPEKIRKIAEFYDYLEIQPLANNRFLIADPKYGDVNSDKDLEEYNRRIVRLGEELGKMVVATCDVHFLNPEDEICRRIILSGNGFKDTDRPEPLYLRTTDEMLDEFSYLGEQKAEEIVVTNPGRICDRIEDIAPVRPDKCPPVIPDSDKILRESCYKRAHEIYGEELPKQVSDRLEKELHSIITNGFAVMYIIAQKLVRKSNEDGYLVGSRGSVGSSLVAYMAGITEVNALSPHYYCPDCHYSDFDSDEVKAYTGGCGWDMPDKICPVCGRKLKKDGFNIPFETFLGFKGTKEPDIDLNFSGEYQAKAHKYTEEIFGTGQTFKAGTIATLADKTAFGYVKHYYEDRGEHKRLCEIDRIVQKCTGVRRSTGQHPGGIIVLPHGEEIHSFTPVQHPANDMNSDIITTHFDYHSIDHNLLKLDILGHDDPTMIRRLEDLTGINARAIPLDDPGVLSLFAGTGALGITPDDIHGCKLGCLGIPEFGTDFVIQMLEDTKPKSLSDLIKISGLSHGTNVWLDNAQTLIRDGKTDLSGAICTRDDIMIYLIMKGLDSAMAFDIMESVRKGKGLNPGWEEAMKENDVPDWYIDSCKKISYMFPRAHAVAYVTMAYRIAYFKINYPLAYYAAYFAIRSSAFSYEVMCRGRNVLAQNFERLAGESQHTQHEDDMIKDMRIVEEMYARGFEFEPLDIYKADPKKFLIVDGKIMPSLSSIEGMGEKAAEALAEAASRGKFLSLDDLRTRSKVPRTVIEKMAELGILNGLPESNQLSLFDLAL